MGTMDDPFGACEPVTESGLFEALTRRPVSDDGGVAPVVFPGIVTARLHAFALDDAPVIAALPQIPNELVTARSAVPLRREEIGATVIVVFDEGDVRRPIVLGVLQDTLQGATTRDPVRGVTVVADDQRYEIKAEREIVLRCGGASITLTRAGKVLIEGTYVLSRSTGYNKIKGAAIDIN